MGSLFFFGDESFFSLGLLFVFEGLLGDLGFGGVCLLISVTGFVLIGEWVLGLVSKGVDFIRVLDKRKGLLFIVCLFIF